jgi:hypothetical protein
VTEDVLDLAQQKPSTQHLGSRRVPEIVEADVLDLRGLLHRVPSAHVVLLYVRAEEEI